MAAGAAAAAAGDRPVAGPDAEPHPARLRCVRPVRAARTDSSAGGKPPARKDQDSESTSAPHGQNGLAVFMGYSITLKLYGR